MCEIRFYYAVCIGEAGAELWMKIPRTKTQYEHSAMYQTLNLIVSKLRDNKNRVDLDVFDRLLLHGIFQVVIFDVWIKSEHFFKRRKRLRWNHKKYGRISYAHVSLSTKTKANQIVEQHFQVAL